MTFREWLRQQIDERGISLRMLAVRSGLSDAAISEWLAGKRHPRPDSLRRLAAALRVPYEEALAAAGYLAQGSEKAAEPELSPMERELLETLRLLPGDLRQPLLAGWLATARGLLRQAPRGASVWEEPSTPIESARPTPA